MKKLLLSLSALLLLAALVFTGIYFTRFQSMAALQKITDYSDGYNLYRMDIRYRYSLNDLLARGMVPLAWAVITIFATIPPPWWSIAHHRIATAQWPSLPWITSRPTPRSKA